MIKFAQTLEEKENNQSMSANEIELTDGELVSVHGAFWGYGYGYNPGYGPGYSYDPSYGFSGYPSAPVVVVLSVNPGSASQSPVDQSPVGPSPVSQSPVPTFSQPSAPVVQ